MLDTSEGWWRTATQASLARRRDDIYEGRLSAPDAIEGACERRRQMLRVFDRALAVHAGRRRHPRVGDVRIAQRRAEFRDALSTPE
jgi:hypothetical protein